MATGIATSAANQKLAQGNRSAATRTVWCLSGQSIQIIWMDFGNGRVLGYGRATQKTTLEMTPQSELPRDPPAWYIAGVIILVVGLAVIHFGCGI
jgi:hypothetical protein